MLTFAVQDKLLATVRQAGGLETHVAILTVGETHHRLQLAPAGLVCEVSWSDNGTYVSLAIVTPGTGSFNAPCQVLVDLPSPGVHS